MDILCISGWFPFPANNGIKLRIFNILKHIAAQHRVHLVSLAEEGEEEKGGPDLAKMCASLATAPTRHFRPTSFSSLLGLLSPQPRSVVDTYSPAMEEAIQDILRRTPVDLVLAFELTGAVYWKTFAGLPAVLDDFETGIYQSLVDSAPHRLSRWRHRLTQLKQGPYFRHLLRQFQGVTVVSDLEKRLLERHLSSPMEMAIIPNCVDLTDYPMQERSCLPKRLIFIGSLGYQANYDAVMWFLGEIYPQVRKAFPEVEILLTGDPAGRSIPSAEGVTQTGLVEDIRPLVRSAAVSVVPLRVGGGTRLKILESLALGTPVVSTSKGAEGLEVANGRHLLIADDPSAFAGAINRLLGDSDLQGRLGEAGRLLVSRKYDWFSIMPGYLEMLERVAAEGRTPSP